MIDLILSAIKHQYSKSEVGKDYTNHYIALLKSEIEDYEHRIKEDKEKLSFLKEEYKKMMDIRRRVEDVEDGEDVQTETEDA